MSTWNTEERAGLGNTAGYIQKVISAPMKRQNPKAGTFDLYYFRPDFRRDPKEYNKTLLFCLGGPGRVLKPHDHIWFKQLSLIGYNIVYFHLRGSGFSQLPESNEYDEYIRTEYAADDIETIRRDLFGKNSLKRWDAVIGYSYGAVLAQQYAHQYPDSVDKLLLIGPISLQNFVDDPAHPARVYDHYEREVEKIRISVIDKIYDLEIFRDEPKITNAQKEEIKKKLFDAQGIFEKIETNFGSEQSVIDNWRILERTGLLKKVELMDDLRFFQALRELHLYGSRTDNDGAVNQEAKLAELGEVIARGLEILPTCICHAQNVAVLTNAPRSTRVFEVMGVYDGINKRFIKEWLSNGSKDVAKCIKQASGIAWTYIPDYEHSSRKVGVPPITSEISITPWSPADHPHNKSTLILKGSADPVTAAEQAESYLKQGVVGPQSILLNFRGVGHEFILPGVSVESEDIHPLLRGGNADTLNCLIYAFVENDYDNFKRVAKPIWEALQAEDLPVSTAKPG